jgi:hypothetical protein
MSYRFAVSLKAGSGWNCSSILILEMKRKRGRNRVDRYIEGSFCYFRKEATVISAVKFV